MILIALAILSRKLCGFIPTVVDKLGLDIPQHKTLEIAKTEPRAYNWNRQVLIYCSKDLASFNRIPLKHQSLIRPLLGKVIGEFTCSEVFEFESEFADAGDYESIARIWHYEDIDAEAEIFVDTSDDNYRSNFVTNSSCVSWEELRSYVGTGIKTFYGWTISNLTLFSTPLSISEFTSPATKLSLVRPPQSYCYVD